MLVVPVKMTKEEESKTSEMTLSDFRSLKWKSQNKVVTRHSWMFENVRQSKWTGGLGRAQLLYGVLKNVTISQYVGR